MRNRPLSSQQIIIDIIDHFYSGTTVVSHPSVKPAKFISMVREVAEDLDCAYDLYIDGKSGIVLARGNDGYPLELPEEKRDSWVEADISRFCDRKMWDSLLPSCVQR